MLTDAELLDLAGKAAFARGRAYRDDGRVELDAHTPGQALSGTAFGTREYAFWLKRDGDAWRWGCACPAADDGSFCKHLVAAVLTARDGAVDDDDGEGSDADDEMDNAAAGGRKPRAKRGTVARGGEDDLLTFLRAQPAERLAGWLRELADNDREIDKRLRLYRAADDPTTLKAALAKVLSAGGFLDYRASLRYAQRLDAAIEQLAAQLARDPGACRTLCEYTLGRLFKLYARSDDSDGAIGDRVATIAQLHASACAAAPPGKALVKPLFALKQQDQWGMFPLEDYWDALGNDGRGAYGRLIAAELERLPPQPGDTDRRGEASAIRRRAEEYARADRDFALLQRILRWDLRHAYDHLKVIDSLREFGKEREALTFAESAVKRFSDDVRLREVLAECLRAAGLGEEALQQRWQAFCLRPAPQTWDSLHASAGTHWPQWRQRALDFVATRENGAASARIRLLMHDGDLTAALALGQTHEVWPSVLRELAERVEDIAPAAAGELYLRLVAVMSPKLEARDYASLASCLRRAARLAGPERWQPVLAAVRATHARKVNLMTLLKEAGL